MKAVNEQEIAPQIMEKVKKGAFLTVRAGEKTNVMTIGWAMLGYIWRRSSLLVAVRKTRYTFGLIEAADSFTVSVPAGNMDQELNLCGTKSGRNLDKIRECRFALQPSQKVSAPLLDIPGYHFECRIVFKTAMDPRFLAPDLESLYPAKDYHTLYFGEVLGCGMKE